MSNSWADQWQQFLDLGFQCQQSVLDDTLSYLTKPQKRVDTLLDGLSSITDSVLSSGPNCGEKLIENQLDLMVQQLTLLERTMAKALGSDVDPVIRPKASDRRFMDDEWEQNPLFDYLKQCYLLNSKALLNIADCLELDEEHHERVSYYLRQLSSALAPSNYAFSNPEVLRKTRQSKGENLIQGMRQLLQDQRQSGDFLNVCMSEKSSFTLGENLAASRGKVVFENDLFQLIQYAPSTSHVRQVPLLITPSWVNKFYILDLRDKNSFVKWAVDHGLTVFMISWVNPDASYRDVSFDDYLQRGLLTALTQVQRITGSETVNTAGYCLGGILLASALSYLTAKGDNPIASATYLASSIDFSDPGEMKVFMDDAMLNGLQQNMQTDGFLDGRALSVSFCLLRENELYWNYFIQNYLKGERPGAFDILYWNTDNTNVPASAHRFVLNDLHRNNAFINQGKASVLGEPLDLTRVTTPVYVLATEKDHIAKWQSAYSATQLHRGSRRFVLAGSGHIAGVINPPASNKYHYYTNRSLPSNADDWLDNAFKHEGSWWGDWYRWLKRRSGHLIEAADIDERHVIEEAPGRFVKVRLDENQQAVA